MIKALKELKKQSDAKLKIARNEKDGDGRVIINMNVREDSGFISPFSDSEKPVISGEVAEFLNSRAKTVPQNERLTLRIYGDCISDDERETNRQTVTN